MAMLAGTAGPVVERLLEEYCERCCSPDRKLLCFFPDIGQQLSTLHAGRLRLALVTSRHRIGVDNSNHGVMGGLERMGQVDLVDAVVGYKDTVNHKAAPDPFLVCMDRLVVGADSAVPIGDSPLDIQGARVTGLRTTAALRAPTTWELSLGPSLRTPSLQRMTSRHW